MSLEVTINIEGVIANTLFLGALCADNCLPSEALALGLSKSILPGLQIRVHTGKLFFLFLNQNTCCGHSKQVAQWATIAHHGASILFGDTIIYNAQRQITLNLKQ